MYMDELSISDSQAREGVHQAGERIQGKEHCCFMSPEVKRGKCIGDALASRLLMIARPQTSRSLETRRSTPEARNQKASLRPKPGSVEIGEPIFIATVGAEGVVDTGASLGASHTVVGSDRVKGILSSLSRECQKNVRKVRFKATFRFGNSGTLDSKWALLIPTSEGAWIRVEVVNGSIPLLISNRLLRELDAIIHVRKGQIQAPGGVVQMRCDQRGLSIVDFAELMQHVTAPTAAVHLTSVSSTEDQQHSQQQPTPADQSQQSSATKTAQRITRTILYAQTLPPCLTGTSTPSTAEKKVIAQVLESVKERLVANVDLSEYLEVKYTRPPGVTTMEAWGKTILSDSTAFAQDLDYAMWIVNRELKAPWALNLQNYVRARLRKAARILVSQSSDKEIKTPDQTEKEDGWERISEGPMGPKTVTARKRVTKDKRGSSSQDMNIEVNHQELAQRRALLLRELGQIDKLEKQAQQQSKLHPEKPETEG